MRRSDLAVMQLWFLLIFPMAAWGEPAKDPQPAGASPGSVTLPLEEILRLQRLADRAGQEQPEPVPLAATVDRIELSGRLLEDSVDMVAHVEFTVLGEDRWVVVPLFPRDAGMHISALPATPNGVISVENDAVSYVTRTAGKVAFDLSFVKKARVADGKRQVELGFVAASLAVLRIRFDEGLFRLLSEDAIKETEGYLLYPSDLRFALRWEFRPKRQAQPRQEERQRPPIESVITRAFGSVVSTLEGKRITRILYELQLEGAQALSIVVPDGSQVEKVFLNNASVAFRVEDGAIDLAVRPARTGDEAARIELLLVQEQGTFNLSGTLALRFPEASWSINELFVELHFPAVFNYSWAGGSLAPAQQVPPAEYSHRIPLPGKTMAFHQQLVSSSPDLRIDYTVDLAGHYYQGDRNPGE